MLDAIGKARVHGLTAEVEVGLAGMPHRPAADAVVEVEQGRLVGDLRARLGGDETARRRWRDRRLLVARSLTDKAAGADRDDTRLISLRNLLTDRTVGSRRVDRRARFRPWRGRGDRTRRGGRCGARGRYRGNRFRCSRSSDFGRLNLIGRFHRRRARFQAQAMRLADHRIAADAAEFVGDLAGGQPFFPHGAQAFDALIGPRHILFLIIPRRGLCRGYRCDPCGPAPLPSLR